MQNQNPLGQIILPSQSTSAIPIVAPPADAAAASTTPKSPILKNAATIKRMWRFALLSTEWIWQFSTSWHTTPDWQCLIFLIRFSCFWFRKATLSQYYYSWILQVWRKGLRIQSWSGNGHCICFILCSTWYWRYDIEQTRSTEKSRNVSDGEKSCVRVISTRVYHSNHELNFFACTHVLFHYQ